MSPVSESAVEDLLTDVLHNDVAEAQRRNIDETAMDVEPTPAAAPMRSSPNLHSPNRASSGPNAESEVSRLAVDQSTPTGAFYDTFRKVILPPIVNKAVSRAPDIDQDRLRRHAEALLSSERCADFIDLAKRVMTQLQENREKEHAQHEVAAVVAVKRAREEKDVVEPLSKKTRLDAPLGEDPDLPKTVIRTPTQDELTPVSLPINSQSIIETTTTTTTAMSTETTVTTSPQGIASLRASTHGTAGTSIETATTTSTGTPTTTSPAIAVTIAQDSTIKDSKSELLIKEASPPVEKTSQGLPGQHPSIAVSSESTQTDRMQIDQEQVLAATRTPPATSAPSIAARPDSTSLRDESEMPNAETPQIDSPAQQLPATSKLAPTILNVTGGHAHADIIDVSFHIDEALMPALQQWSQQHSQPTYVTTSAICIWLANTYVL